MSCDCYILVRCAESPKKKKKGSKSKRRSESKEPSVPPPEGAGLASEETGGGVNGIVASPERNGIEVTEGELFPRQHTTDHMTCLSYHLSPPLLSLSGGDKSLIASATAFKELQKQRYTYSGPTAVCACQHTHTSSHLFVNSSIL